MSNFQELYRKIQAIDENTAPVEECGDMMPPVEVMGGSPSEQDRVSMNVNMSGSGSGGIRDLMDILKNIDNIGEPSSQDAGPSPDDILFGVEEEGFGNAQAGAPGPEIAGIDAVTPTGNDMHSKGIEAPKVNGGGNPLQAELQSKLSELYNSMKEASHQEKTTMKHVKNPTKGEKDAGKDIKSGTAGYADRIAMLKSAEADGRLKD